MTAAVIAGVFALAMPAQSECLSPSAEAGDTATTVFRCPDDNAGGAQLPVVVDPEKTTEVERGSANLPWFEPGPAQTEDPIATPKASSGKKEPLGKKKDVAKTAPPPAEATTPEPADTEAEAPPVTAKTKAKKAQPAMAKPAKVKLAKAKRTKAKLAKKKRSKTRTAKAQTSQQPVKTEPAKADEKVIVWTKKDVSIGNRIVNWLGF